MSATTFTLVTTVPRPRPRRLVAAVRAFGSAAVGVVLLGDLGDDRGPGGAGVRNPRPVYAPPPGPDRAPYGASSSSASTIR
ncbi:hypothetical protein ACFQ8C_14375 [Streptomyces sp. NPDC056503]|uniref:hypothetical protein n=1 Tax=Streptomyces sp. NPDC056503 TaxID=3345842 RepID=UPI0036A49D32